jgi:hypothetical protein
MRRWTLTLVAATLIAAAFPSRGEAVVIGGDCSHPRRATIVHNKWARVIRYGRRAADTWVACWRKSVSDPVNRGSLLVDPGFGDFGFPPPALALAATTVAYARTSESDSDADVYFTRIFVERFFRQSEHGHGEGWSSLHATRAGERDQVKVGSTVVRPNGAFAWIACPTKGRLTNSSGPTCIRPGYSNTVFRVLSKDLGRSVPFDEETETGYREVLDRGRGIDPRSLRRSGDRVSWIKNGRWRYATLSSERASL